MNRSILLKSVFISCSFFLSITLFAQTDTPENVLFVGNSYTYFWNLPQSVAIMAESRNLNLSTRQSTAGGANLGQHWHYEKKLNSIPIITAGNFDAIVIQDHSRRALDEPDSLQHYGHLFGDLIREQGARAYVYMTWARDWDPYMQQEITAQYKALATAIDATVVPVGLAWQRANELRPDLELYHPDGSHPSPTGTYLAACVFFKVLTGQSAIGLPERLITTDKDGETLYLNIQTKENALFCQKVAEEVVSSFKK